MADNENFWGGLFLGGLAVAAMAAPNLQDVQELQQYRNAQSQILARKQRIGDLSVLERLRQNPPLFNLFVESCNMLAYGFYRGACVFSIAVIENLLKEKYKDDNFKSSIDKAKKDALIEEVEEHYLNGLRLDRNSLVHEASREINENEALMTIQLAIRIMKKIL
jgi:hypothetical protein